VGGLTQTETDRRPLAGVRILDLSRLLPGPYATWCLQGLGATVVKVEEPGAGDYLRHTPPFVRPDGFEVGAWFASINRGKRSVALDLRSSAGRGALLALLSDADVLVESFRPGVLARLGLAPELLRERFPRLVVASVTGWGQTGPYAAEPGHDIGFLALSGLLDDPAPRMPSLQWADVAGGGLCAALRIAAALAGRAQTGRGDWLDIAMFDGLIGLQPFPFAVQAAGAPPDRLLSGGLPNYRLYACADGWLAVGALEPQFAQVLFGVTGESTHEDIERVLLTDTRAAWAERLAAACVVPILSRAEVPGHPQVVARHLFEGGLPHPPTGPVTGSVPVLGEHTEAELARVGYVPA
jgi:crotonobetainyl-CoA:carnitine CoA-transferase CaiB-like acyl-CoA transferase